MYKEILEEQLERLQKCQKACIGEPDAVVQLSSMILETAGRLKAENDAEPMPLITSCTSEITLDGKKLLEAVKSFLSEEASEPVPKEEILEDFSTEELVKEIVKRGAANIHRTDDKCLFAFTGNFYTDEKAFK